MTEISAITQPVRRKGDWILDQQLVDENGARRYLSACGEVYEQCGARIQRA